MAFNEQILEGLRPNFFELVVQETMHQALRPAVEYLCKVCVHVCVCVCFKYQLHLALKSLHNLTIVAMRHK